MRNLIYKNTRSVSSPKLPFIFSIVLSLFTFSILLGSGDNEIFNPPGLEEEFDIPCTRTPGEEINHSDGSCAYPDGTFDFLQLDEEFDDNQTKYIYIKAEGDFICGDIFLNPKGKDDCYVNNTVPGPQCNGGLCNTETCNLVEIGYWEDCSGFLSCSGASIPYMIGEHTITFYGYEIDGNDSYWYYKVESSEKPAISHLTFFRKCSNAALGDYVWYDSNHNSLQDEGEFGINDIVVKLYKQGGEFVAQTTTRHTTTLRGEGKTRAEEMDGYYRFDNLLEGDYYLTFDYPGDIYNICDCNAGDDAKDNDFDPFGDNKAKTRDNINLEANEEDMTWDGGLYASILPIHILDFSLTSTRNENHISWSIANVVNEEYIALEKSYDGIEFFALEKFEELYNGSYSYIDNINVRSVKTNYYRLAIVDYNGETNYSNVIMGRTILDYESPVIAYPNPTTGMVTIEILDNETQMRSLVMDDISGKRMMYVPLDNNKSITLSLKDRTDLQGVFLIGVELSNGEVVYKRILLTN